MRVAVDYERRAIRTSTLPRHWLIMLPEMSILRDMNQSTFGDRSVAVSVLTPATVFRVRMLVHSQPVWAAIYGTLLGTLWTMERRFAHHRIPSPLAPPRVHNTAIAGQRTTVATGNPLLWVKLVVVCLSLKLRTASLTMAWRKYTDGRNGYVSLGDKKPSSLAVAWNHLSDQLEVLHCAFHWKPGLEWSTSASNGRDEAYCPVASIFRVEEWAKLENCYQSVASNKLYALFYPLSLCDINPLRQNRCE
jgi:hypothetical protein